MTGNGQTVAQINPHKLIELYREALLAGHPLDQLEEKVSRQLDQIQASDHMEKIQEKKRAKTIRNTLPPLVRYGALVVPAVFLIVGIYLVGNAVVPIVQYYATTLPTLAQTHLTTPIPREEVLDITPLVIAQTDSSENAPILGSYSRSADGGPIILDTELDFTNLANWFDDDRGSALQQKSQTELTYTLDIPKLDIKNAEVKVGGTDLNKNLIAYPGTALPGEAGSPVIFGHSVLRQFYNPSEKNPRRYNSIFSTIMTLKEGDQIFITHNGTRYTYVVREKSEVKPEDTYILAQQFDGKTLKLVTCVPEGTYLRRGVITAELVSG